MATEQVTMKGHKEMSDLHKKWKAGKLSTNAYYKELNILFKKYKI